MDIMQNPMLTNPSLAMLPGFPADYPRRFGWPMRLFIFFLVFNIVFRSMTVLFANDLREWSEQLNMRTWPSQTLPTWEQRENLNAPLSDAAYALSPLGAVTLDALPPSRVGIEYYAFLDAVWEFYKPFPDYHVRRQIWNTTDYGKFAVCWLNSRTDFLGTMAGFPQNWAMFSPGPRQEFYTCRIRLIYEDGSEKIVRQLADPEDPTRYNHWFEEKVLDYEGKAKPYPSAKRALEGYCNLLAHRHRENNGSPVQKIVLRQAVYYPVPTGRLRPFAWQYDPPAEPATSAQEWWAKQQGPPAKQLSNEFFEYDVEKRTGVWLTEKIWPTEE